MTTGHIPFFYVGADFRLTPDDARHFLTVLRRRAGDPLEVADGAGRAWKAAARVVSRREVEAVPEEALPAEPAPMIALATALPKGPRVSYLIEKSVEFGVAELYLLDTRFAAVHDCPGGHLRRLKAVAASAGMQARRPWLPPIHPMVPLARFIETRPEAAVLDPSGDRKAWDALPPNRPTTLLVGPEGGWAPEELALFRARGIPLLPLTRHPLRMETAAVAGLAFWYALKGEAGTPER
jgi:16S rRNA (uracil1498-N3)-methyltransferase